MYSMCFTWVLTSAINREYNTRTIYIYIIIYYLSGILGGSSARAFCNNNKNNCYRNTQRVAPSARPLSHETFVNNTLRDFNSFRIGFYLFFFSSTPTHNNSKITVWPPPPPVYLLDKRRLPAQISRCT